MKPHKQKIKGDQYKPFPILNLPWLASNRVLRNICPMDRLALALTSKKSNKLVNSTLRKTGIISVYIHDCLNIKIECDEAVHYVIFYDKNHRRFRSVPAQLPTPTAVYVQQRRNSDREKWKVPGLPIKDWIERIFMVFNHPEKVKIVDELRFGAFSRFFTMKSVREVFAGIQVTRLAIENDCLAEPTNQVMKAFSSYKELFVRLDARFNLETRRQILAHNGDALLLDFNNRGSSKDLLLINSARIRIKNSKFNAQDFNMFLKEWQSGTNKKLQCFIANQRGFYASEQLIEKDIFIGIKNVKKSKRTFNEYVDKMLIKTERVTKKGLNITRKNGTQAIAIFKQDKFGSTFEFYVFPEN